ncbi:MAG: glycosyltransferase family 4 protein [Candidatus Helarchaeota archaeon]
MNITISNLKSYSLKGNKNIVIYMNPSNGNSLSGDSSYIFNKILINELNNYDYSFEIISQYNPNWQNVKCYQIEQGNNKYAVRFTFNSHKLAEILNEIENFDIFYLNQSEHGEAIKSVFLSTNLSEVPIVTYIHYLPVWSIKNGNINFDSSLNQGGLGKAILRKQLGTCEVSARIIVHSQFARNLLIETANNLKFEITPQKIEIIPPPLDPEVFNLIPNKRTITEPPILIYNSRLYDHYGIKKILRYLKEFKSNKSLKLYVTDPSGKRTPIQDQLDPSVNNNRKLFTKNSNYHYLGKLERNDYFKLLNQCSIGLAPIRPALWSMSVMDLMVLKIPVIAPNVGAYPEMIPSGLLYDNQEAFNNILKELLISPDFYAESSEKCYTSASHQYPPLIASKFDKVFRKLM